VRGQGVLSIALSCNQEKGGWPAGEPDPADPPSALVDLFSLASITICPTFRVQHRGDYRPIDLRCTWLHSLGTVDDFPWFSLHLAATGGPQNLEDHLNSIVANKCET